MTSGNEKASDSARILARQAAMILSQIGRSVTSALTAGFLIQRCNELVNELVDDALGLGRHAFARESRFQARDDLGRHGPVIARCGVLNPALEVFR
ncbi:hypothetical protein M728_000355 [Ensifer sp. WSM1721]